jgi:hypothetical protein
MRVSEKRLQSQGVEYAAVDDGMPATTSICIALVVALILYVLGAAAWQQDVVAGAPQQPGPVEMSFHGP